MDPTSQDNSFGSFGTGGENPGANGSAPPVGGMPVSGTSMGGMPVGGTPVGGVPIGGTSMGGMPVSGTPVGGVPTDDGDMMPMNPDGTVGPNYVMPAGPDTGDIVIGGNGKNRGGRGWIVGVVIIAIAIVGVVLLIIISRMMGGDEGKMDTYQSVTTIDEQDKANFIDFLEKAENTDALTDEEILQLYLDNGPDSAKQVVDNYYSDLLETKLDEGKEYAGLLIEYADNLMILFNVYSNNNCIKDRIIDGECASKIQFSDEEIDAMMRTNEIPSELEYYLEFAKTILGEYDE